MNERGIDEERLRRLLGETALANLRRRLRTRYERGVSRDEFTLSDLQVGERRALAGLLGRPTLAAGSMRVRRSEFDEALVRARIAGSLREALEFLDGPLLDRKADRIAREHAWRIVLARAEDPRLAKWLSQAAGAALLKRLSGSDPVAAESIIAQAVSVLRTLPGRGISLAQLAAELLGDSHGLDPGRPVATMVLRACAAEWPTESIDSAAPRDAEESFRKRWARLGVTVNELALPVLHLNLPVGTGSKNDCAGPRGTPLLGLAPMLAPFPSGEPGHISLRRLLRNPPGWDVAGRVVFICENPNIVAIAADRLGAACAPLVCTDGMPAAAQQTLLAQLAAGGARLRYHGDFDWAGLIIGNFVMRAFGADPWRFGAADYLSASIGREIELRGDERVRATWDAQLSRAMSERKVVVHEEAVVESLLPDLEFTPSHLHRVPGVRCW